jgi:hypothetical protein
MKHVRKLSQGLGEGITETKLINNYCDIGEAAGTFPSILRYTKYFSLHQIRKAFGIRPKMGSRHLFMPRSQF